MVVDQTGLPLPGVRIDVYRGGQIIQSITTEADGTFQLAPGEPGDMVDAALEGFETIRVPRVEANRIVLPIGRANEVTEVVASALTSSGSAMERLGSTMSASLAQRLPTARPHILQSLPLLPSVVRGRDGLLRIGGTRPHESSLWIDGFDVTDPVTGTTAIDLPDESVKGMGVVRDPISATFNGVLGSMASIETTTGGDNFTGGVQGFIPRPRLNRQYGLGRIEAFFPRAYASGRVGIAHFFASTEINFERVPVPGVTSSSGNPASGATGVVSFARVDLALSARHSITLDRPVHAGEHGVFGAEPAAAAGSVAGHPHPRSLRRRRRSICAGAVAAAHRARRMDGTRHGDRRRRVGSGLAEPRRMESELVLDGRHVGDAALGVGHVGSRGDLGAWRAHAVALRHLSDPRDVRHAHASTHPDPGRQRAG